MEKYSFQLVTGSFHKDEALDILTRMVDLKIKFHENKIQQSDNPEDIKMRENRIKQLQRNLLETRNNLEHLNNRIELNSEIVIQS